MSSPDSPAEHPARGQQPSVGLSRGSQPLTRSCFLLWQMQGGRTEQRGWRRQPGNSGECSWPDLLLLLQGLGSGPWEEAPLGSWPKPWAWE